MILCDVCPQPATWTHTAPVDESGHEDEPTVAFSCDDHKTTLGAGCHSERLIEGPPF